MKQSDMNHLRRLLGWIRCDIGQPPAEQQRTMISIAEKLGECGIDTDAMARLVEGYRRAEAVPVYIRDAVNALEKLLPAPGRGPGAEGPRAAAETRVTIGFDPGAAAGREPTENAVGAETYAARLSYAMSLSGIDVSSLAKATGMTYQGVKRATEGRSKAFSAANNARAARVLGVSPEWLAVGNACTAPPIVRRNDANHTGAARPEKPILAENVEAIGIDTRCARMLRRHGIRRVGELVTYSPADLLCIPNFGKRSLAAVEECLQKRGLALGPARLNPVQESETC
ncbi:DNA-directed RNA polymerase subunit alpha C-terminal domain-containing protein [Achromobacter xylosoxidans]